MRRVLVPVTPNRSALVALALAAAAVAVAGVLHGRLFHQGYSDVPVVGPLFFLNVIGSASAVLLLLARRPLLFAGAALSISVGAIVSILISHQSRFFGFSEEGYSADAKAIVVAEAAAALLVGVGLALGRGRLVSEARP